MAGSRRKILKVLFGSSAALLGGAAAATAWFNHSSIFTSSLKYAFPNGGKTGSSLPVTPSCDDEPLDETAATVEGPYYTPQTPLRQNLREADTVGTPLVIEGHVLSPSCIPIEGAVLDFWSCDGNGVYDNDGFRLRGHQYTDSEGRFRVETVKPKDYRMFFTSRTPHIHVKVQGRETVLLTTQLYFPNEPLNKQDGIFKQSLVMDVEEQTDGSLQARFNFVLA